MRIGKGNRPIKRSWCKASLCLAAALIPPGPAAQARDLTKLSDRDLAALNSQLLGKVRMGDLTKACEAAPVVAETARRLALFELDGLAAWMNGICAVTESRGKDALRDFGQFERMAQDSVHLRDIAYVSDRLSLYAAVGTESWDDFVAHATHIALREKADEVRGLDPEVFRFAFAKMPDPLASRIAITFGSLDSFAALAPGLQTLFARQAVLPSIQVKDTAMAEKMAAVENWPPAVVKMLVDRRYESLWSSIAERVGPGLKRLLDERADQAAALAAGNPEDSRKANMAMLTALDAGRFADVERLAKARDISTNQLTKLDEQGAWATQYYAYALDGLGRPAEADALLDGLASLPIEKRDWVLFFAINRAERLIRMHRWAEAATAADHAFALSAIRGSPYIKRAALADRLCARHQSGQQVTVAESNAALADGQSNLGSTVLLAMCLEDRGAAHRLLMNALKDPAERGDALLLLQQPVLVAMIDAASAGAMPLTLLADHADLRAEFEAAGRMLPTALQPATYRWQSPPAQARP